MVALGGRMDGAACRVDWSSGITPCAMSAERSWSAAKGCTRRMATGCGWSYGGQLLRVQWLDGGE